MLEITEIISRWKSNTSVGRFGKMSAIDRNLYRKSTFTRRWKTSLRSTNITIAIHGSWFVSSLSIKTKTFLFLFPTEILNISGNYLDTLGELNCLSQLQELSANNNQLENLRELVTLLSIWPRLKRLDLSRNPMCSKARYRERLIVVANSLGVHRISQGLPRKSSLFRNARWKANYRQFSSISSQLESLTRSSTIKRKGPSRCNRSRLVQWSRCSD